MMNNIFLDEYFLKAARWSVQHERWIGIIPFITELKLDDKKAIEIYSQLKEHNIIKEKSTYSKPRITLEQLETLIKFYSKESFEFENMFPSEKEGVLKVLLKEQGFRDVRRIEDTYFDYFAQREDVLYGIKYVDDLEIDLYTVLTAYLQREYGQISSVILISDKEVTEEVRRIAEKHKVIVWDLKSRKIQSTCLEFDNVEEESRSKLENEAEEILKHINYEKLQLNYFYTKKLGKMTFSVPISVSKESCMYSISLRGEEDREKIVNSLEEVSQILGKKVEVKHESMIVVIKIKW